jgi:electron transport complex protein RnfG
MNGPVWTGVKSLGARSGSLMAMCMICGTLMSGLFVVTRERIEHNQHEYAMNALREVSGNPDADLAEMADLNSASNRVGDRYRIIDDRGGHIYTIDTNDGYNGRIVLWLALDDRRNIRGIRVREHRETPGIGDIIDHRVSSWLDQFIDRSGVNPGSVGWQLRIDGGEFDHVTGATITTRAVTRAVLRGLATAQEQGNEQGNDRATEEAANE